jgi:hypothetical protein
VLKKFVLFGLFFLFTVTVWSVAQTDQNEGDFSGFINDANPFEEYPLRVNATGSTVRLDMRPLDGNLGGDLDTVLYLVDENGNIIAENDDREPNKDSSSLLVFPQAERGQYRIIATRYNVQEGDTTGRFRLNISVQEPSTEKFDVTRGSLLDTGFPIDQEPAEEAEWTILAYYGGDNNLEQGILNDLKEFELAGGSDNTVRIVALVDRNPEYSTEDDNWEDTRLYEVLASKDDDNIFRIDSKIIKEFPNLNTSSGQFFAQFMVWSIEKYPAKNYIVALASHGGGWQGIIQDKSAQTTSDDVSLMTIPDMEQAFAIAQAKAGGEKFALLINDACSMSSVEYFSTIAPYFHMTIASPEIVVDPALDMTLFTQLLRANPDDVDFEKIGQELVDKYIEVDVQKRETNDIIYLTNAVTNLDPFNEVTVAVEAFAEVVNANIASRAPVMGKARSNAYTYTKFMGVNEKVDLGNLMRQIVSESQDLELVSAAQDVLNALNNVKVYGNSGEKVKSITSYYNIYFPEEQKDFQTKYFDQTPLKAWSRMLRNYFNSFTPQRWKGSTGVVFHEPVTPKIEIVAQLGNTGSILNPPFFGMEYVGRKITTGFMTIDLVQADGTSIRYLNEIQQEIGSDENGNEVRRNVWQEGVGFNYITWDGALPVLTDGTQRANELITTTDGVVYFLEGEYREVGSEIWNEVNVTFNAQGVVQSVLNRSKGNDALAVVQIPVGADFRTFNNIVTADGRKNRNEGNTYTWQENGLSWSREPAPNGKYNVGLFLTAFGGATGFTSTTVDIDNTGLNSDLRAELNSYSGFILPRLKDWSPLGYEGNLPLFNSSSPNRTANLRVYFAYIEAGSDNLQDYIDQMVETFGLQIDETTEGTVSGVEVVQLTYHYESDKGTFDGKLFMYQDSPVTTAAYAVETLRDSTTYNLDELYDGIYSGTTLNAFVTPTNAWGDGGFETANFSTAYNVRNDWTNETNADNWHIASPSDDKNTFFATNALAIQSDVQGVDGLLSFVLTGRVTADIADLVIKGNQFYYGQDNTEWSVTTYQGTRDDQTIYGRVYVTTVGEESVVLWMETPLTNVATAETIVRETLEPMVNSYRIIPTTTD